GTGRAAPQLDRPVTLQEAIQIAFQNHGSIAVAEESVEQARQRVREARTGNLPSIIGSVGYAGRGTSNLGGLFGPAPVQVIPGAPGQPPQRVRVDTDNTTFNQGLQPRITVDYNVFNGGLTRAQVRQARANLESSIGGLGGVRNNQTFTVTSDYITQLRSERTLELRRLQEDLALEQLRRVEARIRVGSAAEADRALVLSEYRNRQVDRIAAENDVRVSANALRNSMGLPVGPALQLVQLRESVEPVPPVERLRETALRQRPEVIQDEALVRASQQSVSIARIGRKPRLDTLLSFEVNPNDPTNRSGFTFSAAVSLPIWDAGLTFAREQEARSQVESASARLEQTRKDVTADVEEAYLNLVNARQRLEASRLAVEAARVNLEATTARYDQGLAQTTVVDLIQAQVQFATASNSAIQALYDVYLAQAQLDRAVGR
ncbi:MAG TPA: TolC family protein, partial [Armatimonadota bacterium]|nr:TolC family protein [Armatimonadota bacterium]